MPPERHRLTVRGLSNTVVHGVDLELTSGECVCLQGPSGAGKSRLVRAICDLDVSSGEVLLDDRSRNDIPAPEWRRLVALLPAESTWWEDVVSTHFKGSPPYPPTSLGLAPDILEQPVARLSSGERQRLALLRVLALAPRFLLLDEPTSNLDSDNRQRMESLVHRHVIEAGVGVLWITHDDHQARRVGDRVIHIHDGRMV